MIRQETGDCGYCKQKENSYKSYEEEIERERVRECQKALEREKISKGMQSTREDEIQLREMQKLQMEEKKRMEMEQAEIDRMWHEVLVDEVKRKEYYERIQFQKRQKEMQERRKAYDEQIASANRKRQEALRQEREKENRRLERMRRKMEEDHFEEIRKKKEQQTKNKRNFIEGHEAKMAGLLEQRAQDREIDTSSIKRAMEELKQEESKKITEMHNLRKQKHICLEYQSHKNQMTQSLQHESDQAAEEFRRQMESRADERARGMESARRLDRMRIQEEYKKHLQQLNEAAQKQKQHRSETMKRVQKTALMELQKKLEGAKSELNKQIEYRNSLNRQICENQKILETQSYDIEIKQQPFTRKFDMFKDAMEKVDKSPGRKSTNPVHPFRRIIEKQKMDSSSMQLPLIGHTYSKIK